MRSRHPAAARARRVATPAIPLVLALLAAPHVASARWVGDGTGPAAVKGTAVIAVDPRPTSNRPLLSSTVTVSWTAVTVPVAVSGYVVTRYDGNGVLSPMTNGSCLGATRNTVTNVVTTGTSCTDERGLSGGTFTYRVQPVLERWIGPLSDVTTPAV